MPLRNLLAALVLLVMAGGARADVGVPGFKWIDLHVRFENLEDYSEHAFFFVANGWLTGKRLGPGRPESPPRLSSSEAHRPGYPLRFDRNWVLVAVPRKMADEAGASPGWGVLDAKKPGVLHSQPLLLQQPGSVPFFVPKEGELHRFRIDIENGQLTVSPLAVERTTSPEGWAGLACVLCAVLGSASLAWLGIKWARRRWRQPASFD